MCLARQVYLPIYKLLVGDEVQVTKGDGTVLSYAVVSVNTVKSGDVDIVDMMISAETGKPGLNLITCEGQL